MTEESQEQTQEQNVELEKKEEEKLALRRVEEEKKALSMLRENSMPVMYTDFDHKAFIITSRLKSELQKPSDVLTKDLQTSFIDVESAYLYSQKLSCVLNWLSLGMPYLARLREVELHGRLALLKSVGGFERRAQAGMTFNEEIISESEKLSKRQKDEPEEDLFGGMKKLLKR